MLEAVLESGANGSLTIYPPGLPPGVMTAPSTTKFKVPGSVTITASAAASVAPAVYNMKYSAVDDGRGTELEVVIQLTVTN